MPESFLGNIGEDITDGHNIVQDDSAEKSNSNALDAHGPTDTVEIELSSMAGGHIWPTDLELEVRAALPCFVKPLIVDLLSGSSNSFASPSRQPSSLRAARSTGTK